MVLEKVISIIADVLSVDPDKITEETNLDRRFRSRLSKWSRGYAGIRR